MPSYLEAGWYTRKTPRRLRDEVIDGALDSASKLFQANVEPQALASLALRVRGMAFTAQPPHAQEANQDVAFDSAAQEGMANQLALVIGPFPELESFARECLTHVNNPGELRAFYLHLLHIAQMMQLLASAETPETGS